MYLDTKITSAADFKERGPLTYPSPFPAKRSKYTSVIGTIFASAVSMSSCFRVSVTVAIFAMFIGWSTPSAAGPIWYGPIPYLQNSDSPFTGTPFSYFFLENFEDGLLNTSGVSASAGVVNTPNFFLDSVDGDDGVINGSGSTTQNSYYPMATSVTFTFDAGVLGLLPTHAGLVWTDIGYNSPTPYFGPVSFEAFGPLGVSLGVLGPFLLGDGTDQGQTAEDRFFGVFNLEGISALRVTTDTSDWELDHVQYGAEEITAVPEPAMLALFGLATLGLSRRLRRSS